MKVFGNSLIDTGVEEAIYLGGKWREGKRGEGLTLYIYAGAHETEEKGKGGKGGRGRGGEAEEMKRQTRSSGKAKTKSFHHGEKIVPPWWNDFFSMVER